jgi:hypothetical protein
MWNWIRKPSKNGFPKQFKVQSIEVKAARAISHLPAPEIAKYFREHPRTASALLVESCDKRFTPSSFLAEEGSGLFRVGWYSADTGYECVKDFTDLADAAADYLCFRLARPAGRPPSKKSETHKRSAE